MWAAAGEDKPGCEWVGLLLRHTQPAVLSVRAILPQPPGRLKAPAENGGVPMGAGPAARATVTIKPEGAAAATPD